MIPYQISSAIIGFFIAFLIMFLVRRDRMYSRYTAWWFVIAVSVVIFGCFPRLSDYLAKMMGISYGPTLVFAAGGGMILIKMLTMDLERSHMELRLRRLTQRLALLENMLEQKGHEVPPMAGSPTKSDPKNPTS